MRARIYERAARGHEKGKGKRDGDGSAKHNEVRCNPENFTKRIRKKHEKQMHENKSQSEKTRVKSRFFF